MNALLADWKNGGSFISFGPNGSQLFVKEMGDSNASVDKTLLLLHGFPESSFSYSRVVNGLLNIFDRIILFDMIGYGFSDKPVKGYSYSLMDQADSAFEVWRHFGISGGHLLAHDMGNSVATEIIAREVDGKLPIWFSSGFKSLTLTNGSVVLKLASLRFMQKMLLTKMGFVITKFMNYPIFQQQIKSAHGNDDLSDEVIELLWEGNKLKNGTSKSHLMIKYLNDRKRYESSRWLPALGKTKIPVHICWGKDDAVARVEMAYYLKEQVCSNAVLTIMDGVGHFCQLGSPEAWGNAISSFFENNFENFSGSYLS